MPQSVITKPWQRTVKFNPQQQFITHVSTAEFPQLRQFEDKSNS